MRSVSSCSTTDASIAASFPKPLTVGRPPWRTAGHGGLVELHHQRRAGEAGGDRRDVCGDALGEGLREIPPRPRIHHGPVAAGPFEPGGQRPRAGRLHLERTRVPRGDVVQRVEVALQELSRAPLVHTGSRHQAPAGRGEVHGEVDQQRRTAADQIRARAAARQLGQVGELRQLPDHQPHGLLGIGPGKGPDAGGGPPHDGDRTGGRHSALATAA